MVDLTPRPVLASVEELLGGAVREGPFVPDGARSAVAFERVRLDGAPHLVKYLHADDDFAMRAYGDLGSRTTLAFAAGLFDAAPDAIDHAVVGIARGTGRHGWGCAVLMRDVSAELASTDDSPFADDEHAGFVDHLARLCAATWGWHDDVGLLPYAQRWALPGPDVVAAEAAAAHPERLMTIVADGWERFAARVPASLAAAVHYLQRAPWPLADALRRTPSCFLHGDWKASNLGTGADGRTLLLDWVYLGEGPACHELGWYLALNRQKLPVPKEATIDAFRRALEAHGVETDGWWEAQLDLALLGTLLQFGWEKALGDDDELRWWCERAEAGLARL